MKTLSFLRPEPSGFDRLIADDSIRSAYTSSLALIHDLICEFDPQQGQPRFHDEADLVTRIKALSTVLAMVRSLSEVDRSLLENIEQNAKRALELRSKALTPQTQDDGSTVREEIAEFLDSLLSTYRDAIQLGAGSTKQPMPIRP
jgi:hypothetical protein